MPFYISKGENIQRGVRYYLITKPRDFSAVTISGLDGEGRSQLVFAGIILVTGRGILAGNYADVVINIYDNNGPNGRHLCPVDMRISSANSPFSYDQSPPLYCESGYIYVEWLTTGNGNYQIIYDV